MPKKDRLVFSIGPGGGRSHREPDSGSSGPATSAPPQQQSPRVRRERAGRKGKTVTVAEPFRLTREDGAALLAELKRACGSGGSVKVTSDREGRPALSLEVQGDHAEAVTALLQERGFQAKRAGG